MLSAWGYIVITHQDADTALIAIRAGLTADLIITDYRMQGIDGLEFIAQVRQCAPRIPVMMQSGDLNAGTYLKAIGLGAFECLEKTADTEELRRVLERALEAPVNRSTDDGAGGLENDKSGV
jgi:DNA-binding NtrC family response regulator